MIRAFRNRARRYGLGDALVVFGLPLIVLAIATAAVVRLAAVTLFGA
jgi:hypothetical protein